MNPKYYYLAVGIAALFLIATFSNTQINGIKNLASVFFVDSVTAEELKKNFNEARNGRDTVKILIVPGHDDKRGGTEFSGTKEWELTIAMAEMLTELLRQKDEFEVYITRNNIGYDNDIQAYIENDSESIRRFREEHKDTMDKLIRSGLIDTRNGVEHNSAPDSTALRLYGINKWANENDIDIVLHIHFNDHPGRTYNRAGEYSGITIYIPERQFSNSTASKMLAETVWERLTAYFAPSDMPGEAAGIVEDQDLIAVGAYNTLDPAVLLVEYGYIYEPQFANQEIRALALKELALQTYLGILDFFGATKLTEGNIYNTSTLPYLWDNDLKEGVRASKDVYALQTALAFQFFYPPPTKSKNDCPINGNFGQCTGHAVMEFQKRYGIKPASGFVGPLTRSKLNELYTIEARKH